MNSPPSRSPSEPAPPLRGFFDLPLRHTLPADIEARVLDIERRTRESGEISDWPAVYRDAIAVLEDFIGQCSRRIDALHAQVQAAYDPNEIKQRRVAGPRREAERVLNEVKGELTRVAREWIERGGRQAEQVERQLRDDGERSLAVVERMVASGVEVAMDRAFWDQFSGHVARGHDVWSAQYVRGADAAFRAAVAPLVSVPVTRGEVVPEPPGSSPAPATAPMGEPTAARLAEIPSVLGALGAFVRANMMAATAVTSVITGMMAVAAFSGDGSTSSLGMVVRGLVLVGSLPPMLGLGVLAALNQRKKLLEKAVADHREASAKALGATLSSATERHRKMLDRWTNERSSHWQGSVTRWWQNAAEPALAQAEAAASIAMREARAQQIQMQEELSHLKTQRNQLQQTLVVDLKRRLRDVVG